MKTNKTDIFQYQRNTLYCENVSVADIAGKFGTPVYIYSQQAFLNQFHQLREAFHRIEPLICFSAKACSNTAILRLLVKAGAGLDIVSGGELVRAKKAGCPASRIVFAGVGKNRAEIKAAIAAGIYSFDVESEPELARINAVTRQLGKKKVRVALRLNPDVESGTHHYITTAKKENKFGIDFKTARAIYRNAGKYPHLAISGAHLHIGSQITQVSPFVHALEKTLAFLQSQKTVRLEFLNIGGGMGIVYDKEAPFNPATYGREIERILQGRKLQLVLEPGRYLSGNSGIFVTQVEYVKRTPAKNFLIVNGAMNDLIRPSLYGAYHHMLPVRTGGSRQSEVYDVVGPVCESGDFFAKGRRLARMKEGDLLAVMSAGAYGFVMAGNYNTRPMAAEVLVHGKEASLIRKRQTVEDCLRGEIIPAHLR